MWVHKPKKRQGRTDRRFRPGPWSDGRELESGLELETRVLLSARVAARIDTHHARATTAPAAAARITPAAEISDQYNAFVFEFDFVLNLYVQAINEQSSATTVTAKLTAPWTPTNPTVMQVNNAAAFFPQGVTTTLTATATYNNTPSTFYLLGYTGNTLSVQPASSTQGYLPTNTILTATVTTSAQTSAAGIFPSFIINSTNQMAINLVQYFNSLPLKLPYFNAPPHTPNSRGAIQNYVYNSVAGAASTSQSSSGTGAQGIESLPGIGATSLQQLLLAIPLPTTSGSDLTIYDQTVADAIQQSLTQTLNGVAEVYAGKILVSAPARNNRYGVNASGTIPSYILAQP